MKWLGGAAAFPGDGVGMVNWNGGGGVIDRAEQDNWNAPAAYPSLVPTLPRERADNLPVEIHPQRCPEIDCVRHLLPPALIDLAETHAEEAGVGADRVLITWGILSEETYVAALATSLGIEFEPLFGTPRSQCPLSDDRLSQAANTGMLPLVDRNGVKIVVAPRLVDSRRLVAVATSGADVAQSIRITSTARLHAFVTYHSVHEIERRAVDDLCTQHPELSAGVRALPRLRTLACAALMALALIAVPSAAMTAVEIFLSAVFLAWTGLRLFGLFSERLLRRNPHTFSDEGLPIYSIVIALYREAEAVPGLVAALRALDYPGIMAQTPQAE